MARIQLISLSALVAIAAVTPAARAADSFDACRGFIPSLPAVISTQGVWCLDKDLTTAQATGAAITIDAHNVTIDCNGYKLGGLAAGAGTETTGIATATDRVNATVRGCNLRGFLIGMVLKKYSAGDGGHLVEDNRLEAMTFVGMNIEGYGSVVRRNLIRDTGGGTVFAFSIGLASEGTTWIDDNIIVGASPGVGGSTAWGVLLEDNDGGAMRRNHVTDIVTSGGNGAVTAFTSTRLWIDGNRISGVNILGSVGLECTSATTRISNNSITGFGTGESGCSRPAVDNNDIP